MRISTYCILYFVYAYLSRIAHYENVESTHIHAVCMNKHTTLLYPSSDDSFQIDLRENTLLYLTVHLLALLVFPLVVRFSVFLLNARAG